MKEDISTSSTCHQFLPIRSSKPLQWQGIEAVQCLVPPGHASVQQDLSSHLLILYLGVPSLVIQTSSFSSNGMLADTFVHKEDHAFMPAGRRVEGRWPMDIDILFLHFDPTLIRSIAEASDIETHRAELLPHPFLHDRSVEHFGHALLHEIHSSGLNTRLYAESLASVLALHLLRHYSTLQKRELRVTSDLSKTRLRQVLDYIHEYYTRDLSIAELATVAAVSSSYFARLFRKMMGMAPHEYLIACRVEHAKRILLTEDRSLHEVASSCGFADQSHLTRHFRRILGITPGMLQQEYRNVP